ncbi:MAG: hemerythrin family protein [Deltaproteobacteria bacterium]|nr:hemerythrin family protein [Deltaproteobacteria bacterium]
MSIEWSRSLATGLEWQDNQHKELFKRISSLIDAMNVGLGREEVGRLFKFLDEYFVVHFNAEDEAMMKYNFPGGPFHMAEHRRFQQDVELIREECNGNITTGTVIKVQRLVVDWLINHIGGIDKALGEYILRIEKKAAFDAAHQDQSNATSPKNLS